MTRVGFCTPLSFGEGPRTFSQSLLEKVVDPFLYVSGPKAVVIKGTKEAVLYGHPEQLMNTTLKTILLFTVWLPVTIVMFTLKVALRCYHNYQLIDPAARLGEGLTVSTETLAKIKKLLPLLEMGGSHPDVEWLHQDKMLVFNFKENPDIVFKIAHPGRASTLTTQGIVGPNELIDRSYFNLAEVQKVILGENLNLLKMAPTKGYTIKEGQREISVLAQKRIPHLEDSKQEQYYSEYASQMTKTAEQLTVLVAKTGASDIRWKDIPITDTDPLYKGDRKVTLYNLDETDGARDGVYGSFKGRLGVLNCLFSEESIDAVIKVAQKHRISPMFQDEEAYKKTRLERIESDKKLAAFYQEKGVTANPRQPLFVNKETLGLNLEESLPMTFHRIVSYDTSIKREEIVDDVVNEINQQIQKQPAEMSVKGKRSIYLNIHQEPFNAFESKGQLEGVVQALIDQKYLFGWIKKNGHGYFLQA